MYKIKLKDGKELKNLTLNGNNFISKTEIKDSDLTEENLTTVEITSNDANEQTMVGTFKNMFLVQNKTYGSEWWFILAEKTKDMKSDDDITSIQEAIVELYELINA